MSFKEKNMNLSEILKQRRSYYAIGSDLPVPESQVVKKIEEYTELVPDAFNMKSSRVVLALGKKQDLLWDAIYDAFGGKVKHEKLDGFKAGAGTVLFFYDTDTVTGMQKQFPGYADNFPLWALQASGMLQFTVWSGLRELGIGATVQHYNPVIDEAVAKLFGVPKSWKLISQMPFGNILEEPEPKDLEDISKRVIVSR